MRFVCKQENLIKALNKMSGLVGKNFNLPILNNILIKTDEDGIEILATNLEVGIKTKVRGKIEEKGRITIPAKIFTDYITLINGDENIEIKTEEDKIIIKSGEWQTKIKTSSAEDYPLIPEIEEKQTIKLKIDEFKKTLNQVLFAASFDEARPELTGVLFWLKDNKLILTTTDSYRLAEKKNDFNEKNEGDIKVIVPLKTFQEINKIINNEEDEEIKVVLDENQIKFEFGENILISRLIEGEYPDYKQIIPDNFKTSFEVDSHELIKAIKAASLFTKSGIFDITFEIKKDILEISSINSQVGENNIKIKTNNFSGEDVKIIFNYRYLLDGLQNIQANKIKILVNSESSPAIFKPTNQDEYLYLVMPIRQ